MQAFKTHFGSKGGRVRCAWEEDQVVYFSILGGLHARAPCCGMLSGHACGDLAHLMRDQACLKRDHASLMWDQPDLMCDQVVFDAYLGWFDTGSSYLDAGSCCFDMGIRLV